MCVTLYAYSSYAEVELQHWWTSKGEQAALQVLVTHLKKHNIDVDTSPVKGGGGDSSLMVLQARALAGNTPHFAQIEGASIKAWDAIGILHDINPIAEKHNWDNTLTPLAIQFNKTDNGYVALPITLHKMNWLWSNRNLLNQLDLKVPTNWDELIKAMRTAKSQGVVPLAIGRQPWQIAQLFEHIAISIGGTTFYQQALVDLDTQALNSAQMNKVVSRFRELSSITGNKTPKRSWDEAARLLANEQALFLMGGDWILGELMSLGVSIPDKITCTPTPGTENVFVYNMDSFIFMNKPGFSQASALVIADALADSNFQVKFNQVKGSIPVHKGVPLEGFNPCQKAAVSYLHEALKGNNAVPSMIDSMAVNPVKQNAITNELFRFFTDTRVDNELLIKRLLAIAESS